MGAIKNVFNEEVTSVLIERINQLSPDSQRKWGKMDVAQMLAHCNVTYEYIFEPEKHKKPGALKRLILKTFVKPIVTNEKIYKKNSPTAPDFKMSDPKDFQDQQKRLIAFI